MKYTLLTGCTESGERSEMCAATPVYYTLHPRRSHLIARREATSVAVDSTTVRKSRTQDQVSLRCHIAAKPDPPARTGIVNHAVIQSQTRRVSIRHHMC